MKNTKIIFLSIVSIVAFFNSSLIKASQEPGFELYNKAPHPITVNVSIIGTKFNQMNTVASGGKFPLTIDLDATIGINIYNPRKTAQEMMLPPDYVYTLYAPGKTKYVTWNPAKNPPLYPQTGRLMGFSGISDTGYSLGNNLTSGAIVNNTMKKDPNAMRSIITFD